MAAVLTGATAFFMAASLLTRDPEYYVWMALCCVAWVVRDLQMP